MNHTFKMSVSYVNINQEGLQISANGQNFVWFDERERVAIGNTNPDYVFDVTGDGRFTTNLNVDGDCITAGTATAANLVVTANAPSSSTDSSGTQHEIRVDDSYIYVKMSDGNWGRVAHSTW